MPIPLFNSIASWILKKRIHQMELFMKYPNEVQNELLHELIKKASKTETGKLYEFKTIKSYNIFKSRVPLCNYDDIELNIDWGFSESELILSDADKNYPTLANSDKLF